VAFVHGNILTSFAICSLKVKVASKAARLRSQVSQLTSSWSDPNLSGSGDSRSPASALIDQPIAKLTDWRGKTCARIRKSILEADREIIEQWKWMGGPLWSHDGMIAVGNAHKDKVKLTFSHRATLPDPDKLFTAGFKGNAWRAIDFFEGDKINESALRNLVRSAVDSNQSKLKRKAPAGIRAKVHSKKLRSDETTAFSH